MKIKKMPSQEELNQESHEWNNWEPGSGRKGWSPFNKEIPPVRMGTIPLRDGKIDIKKWEEELKNVRT